jgi:hypothetical protein
MHPSRFDALARFLGARASRRSAMRSLGAGGLGGSLLAAAGLKQATPLASSADAAAGCTHHGCRCHGGVEDACNADLVCCPDNPGLAGGPGRCVREQNCNNTNCTGEGCACSSGVQDACDDGFVCCADDSSLPGGPGRCETEDVCFEHQCQATTNPCPSSCNADSGCTSCCSGYCGPEGHCATPVCSGTGCECGTGMQQSRCDEGLTCCPSNPGEEGGPGICTMGDC